LKIFILESLKIILFGPPVCLSVCLFTYLTMCPSVCLSVLKSLCLLSIFHPSVCLFICLSDCFFFICTSVYLSFHRGICLSICLSLHLSFSLSFFPFVHTFVNLSISLWGHDTQHNGIQQKGLIYDTQHTRQ
jgi:hypothetical protein